MNDDLKYKPDLLLDVNQNVTKKKKEWVSIDLEHGSGSMNDILTGAISGVHNTFIAAPTGVITEFVTAGNIMNQVVTGMASYGVGAGYMATGCGFGPHQVYGLPLLLN